VNYILDNSNTIIKAGFLQFQPQLGNPDENMRRIGQIFNQVENANLIVLPELSNSGYNFESKEQAFSLAEESSHSRFIDFLTTLSDKYNTFIVSGFNDREKDKLFNSSILVGPEGLIGKYRKMHLFMNEWDFFEKGNLGLPVFNIGHCRIGMLVCFDWIFPEVWRILAIKGADIICHPSNLVLPYAQQAVPVHGLINRTYNITANRIGVERGITFTGQSIISDPLGRTLRMASPDTEEIAVVQLDLTLARNKMVTPRNHAFNDRLPSEYSLITKDSPPE
jgi:predicted amidohydrolase